MKKQNNPNWNGGVYWHQKGYKMILVDNHPSRQKYVMEHRLVMEIHLGRYLKKKEVIHHINERRDDNRIENLVLCANNAAHRKLHKLKGWSRKYECCLKCKTTKISHGGLGLCEKCYEKKKWIIRKNAS